MLGVLEPHDLRGTTFAICGQFAFAHSLEFQSWFIWEDHLRTKKDWLSKFSAGDVCGFWKPL